MNKNIFRVDYLEPKIIRRLFSRISFDNTTGCWNWKGNKSKSGYGRIRYLGKKVLVHRLMFAWITGKSLSKVVSRNNLIIDHICNNKCCCNPDHLRLTTHKINMLRGNGPSARQARQTHCKRGHLLPTKKNKFGRRHCQICNTIWARENYRKKYATLPEKIKA